MKDQTTSWIGTGLSAVFTALQTNEVLQIISFIFSIICSIATLSFTFYKWYKKASQDGKIDVEEVEEGVNIIKDGMDDLKETIDDKTRGSNK